MKHFFDSNVEGSARALNPRHLKGSGRAVCFLLLRLCCAAALLFCGSALHAQTKISDYSAFTVLASGDVLLGNDVSDTTMAASGTTKKLPISVLTAYYAALSVTETNKTLTTPTITGGVISGSTTMGIRSTGAAFDLNFAATEVFTANRTLTWIMGDANRTITLGGNITTGGAVTTGGAFTLSGAYAFTGTLTGATTVTFPTTGTLATLAGSETLTTKTINLTSNTLSGTSAQFNTANSDDNFAFVGAANTFTLAQTISDTTASTSSITGALIIGGGLGAGKDSWINTVRIGLGAGADSSSLAVGTGALNSNVSGTGLTAIGYGTLAASTGSSRVAVGTSAGAALTTGSGDVALGAFALSNATSTSGNVAIGHNAGRYQLDGTTALTLTGSTNIFIGPNTRGSSNSQANSITIGDTALSDGSNSTVIGNSSTSAARIEGVVSMPDGIRVSAVECQNVVATTATVGNTATTIPLDNTIPQNTEGAQVLTATITPTSATSTLEITFHAWFSLSATGYVSVALFQDSTANALVAQPTVFATASYAQPITLRYTMTAGTTSATTFKIRYGPSTGTAYFLQQSTGALFSTAIEGVLEVREIRP